MKLRFFLKSDLSLTWLGWLSVTLIAAVVAVLSYAQLQDRLQRQMLNAVRETDVIAEFCSRQPTLRNEDCTFEEGQARVQLSDQAIWLLLAEAQVLSSDEILSYSALKTVETLPAGVAHLVGFLRESGRSTESGLALLRSAARACSSGITTPEGDNRSAEGIRVAIAMMLGEVYLPEITVGGQRIDMSDASNLLSAEGSIPYAELAGMTQGIPFAARLRTSVSREITDAEIVAALFQLSSSIGQSQVGGPTTAGLVTNPDRCSLMPNSTLHDEDTLYEALQARTQFALFVAGQLRSSESVKSARFWLTLFTGPEQMALMIIGLFAFLLAALRLTTVWVQWMRGNETPGPTLPGGPPSKKMTDLNRDEWDHWRGQMLRKLGSARWPLRVSAALLPAIGFVGTVRGIMNSLTGADQIVWATTVNERSSAISALSGDLGLAFATTLLALLGGIVLTLLMGVEGRLIDLVVLRRLDGLPEREEGDQDG